MTRVLPVLFGGLLAAGSMIIGAALELRPQPVDMEKEDGVTLDDFSAETELIGTDTSVIHFYCRCGQITPFQLSIAQRRPDTHYLNGEGVIFTGAFLWTQGHAELVELSEFYLGDQDVVRAHVDERDYAFGGAPFANAGASYADLRGSFAAGESLLVVAAWGAPGTIWLNVTGGAATVHGPWIYEQGSLVYTRDVASVGAFAELGLTTAGAYRGAVTYDLDAGSVVIWAGDLYTDSLRDTTGGLTCRFGQQECARTEYAFSATTLAISTAGSASISDPDLAVAAIIPTIGPDLPLTFP